MVRCAALNQLNVVFWCFLSSLGMKSDKSLFNWMRTISNEDVHLTVTERSLSTPESAPESTLTTDIIIILHHVLLSPPQRRDIDIYSFHINSTVTSRYAVTVITSHVSNRLRESSEVHFQVKIPRNAFISKFRMTMEGKTYDGVVKEKEEAQRQYSQAVSRGESAGMVRTLEEFKTSVAVAASSKVTFELTYEELLIRRLGKYQLLINAQPMQPVADFKVKLKAWLDFHPTEEQQTKCKGCAESGLNGDLIITYDVERLNPSGELSWKSCPSCLFQALFQFSLSFLTDIKRIFCPLLLTDGCAANP
uniref:VIT domain-containing protein n=1 Tax=Pygocentrus nattereri TaxID=42514 RepID=A0AAR2K921_PYGNA